MRQQKIGKSNLSGEAFWRFSLAFYARPGIPDALIEHAGLKDKVVFVGKAQKFQIWDAERYAPIEAEALARVKARMERARNGDAA